MSTTLMRLARALALSMLGAAISYLPAAPAQASVMAPVPPGPFNALVYGNFRSSNADSEGSLVVGGAIDLHTYGVNSRSGSAFGLWTREGGTLTNGHVWGSATSNVMLERAGVTGGNRPDVGDATALAAWRRYYNGLSSVLAQDPSARNAYRDPYSGLVLQGEAAANRHVFNVRAADLQGVRLLDIRGVDVEEELVINIIGDMASWVELDLSSTLGRYRSLLNYVDATIVHFRNTAPWADVLAPFATITGESGHIQGTLVAASFDSTLELHMGKTDFWNVPMGAGNAVPLPDTLALSAAGLFAAAWVRLRRREVRPSSAA